MNQEQKKYYNDKLNQYEFIQYTGTKLYFYHNDIKLLKFS